MGIAIFFIIVIFLIILGVVLFLKRYKREFDYDLQKQQEYEERVSLLRDELIKLETKITEKQNYVTQIEHRFDSAKDLSKSAFNSHVELLEKQYEENKNKYHQQMKELNDGYEKKSKDLDDAYQAKVALVNSEIDKTKEELNKMAKLREAAISAQLREQEIKEQLSFYCLQINDIDKSDIQMLENVKSRLSKPRILSMLIWSTYFQKPMTTLCNNILGTGTKRGIYKITNQLNNMCYIGQSADIATRWKDHAKCGLGIDTPQNNKLYIAMQKDGIWNFSWELLEECPRDQLNLKEREFIALYDSCNFGYNSTKGNR